MGYARAEKTEEGILGPESGRGLRGICLLENTDEPTNWKPRPALHGQQDTQKAMDL